MGDPYSFIREEQEKIGLGSKPLSPYEDFEDNVVGSAQQNLDLVLGSNPDENAESQEIAKQLNIPVESARDGKEEFGKLLNRQDASHLYQKSPKTTSYIASLKNAEVSHDDIDTLSELESIIGRELSAEPEELMRDLVTNPGKALLKQVPLFSINMAKTVNQAGAFIGGGLAETLGGLPFVGRKLDKEFSDAQQYFLENSEWLQNQADTYFGISEGKKGKALIDNPQLLLDPEWMTMNVGQASQSIGQMLMAAYLGGPVAGYFAGGAMEGLGLYEELKKKNVPESKAASATLAFGMTVGMLNKFGLDRIMKGVSARTLAGRVKHRLVTGGVEGITEYAEEPFQAAFSGLAEGKRLPDIVNDMLISLRNIDVIPGAMITGYAFNSQSIADSLNREKGDIEKFLAEMDELLPKSDESLTKQRSSEAMNSFFETAGLGEEVYMSSEGATILFQTDPEKTAEIMDKLAVNAGEALIRSEAGEDIEIKLSQIPANLTAEEWDLIKMDIKPAPGAMTAREAEVIDPIQEVKRIENSLKQQNIVFDEIRRLRKETLGMGLPPEYVDHVLSVYDRFATRMSNEEGFDASDFFSRLNLSRTMYDNFRDDQLRQDRRQQFFHSHPDIEEYMQQYIGWSEERINQEINSARIGVGKEQPEDTDWKKERTTKTGKVVFKRTRSGYQETRFKDKDGKTVKEVRRKEVVDKDGYGFIAIYEKEDGKWILSSRSKMVYPYGQNEADLPRFKELGSTNEKGETAEDLFADRTREGREEDDLQPEPEVEETNQEDLTRSVVAWVRPEEFVAATTTGNMREFLEQEMAWRDQEQLDIDLLREDKETPFLYIDEDGNITGHEGRHRMIAMERAGIEFVPIVVHYQDQAPAVRDRKEIKILGGQGFQSLKTKKWRYGKNLFIRNAIPLTFRNQGELADRMNQGRILFQEEQQKLGPVWYSGLHRYVQGLKQEKGPPQQWLGMIRKLGTNEERQWSGIEEWLESFPKKEKITKQQILDFLMQDNKAKLEERFYGRNADRSLVDSQGPEWNMEQAEGMNLQTNNFGEDEASVNFAHRTEPGGEAYKELVIYAPDLGKVREKESEELQAFQNRMVEKYGGMWSISDLTEEEAQERQRVNDEFIAASKNVPETYTSHAFPEPNIIVWIRFNERTDTDGNKVLFIEEIQSDLHQEGREKGYHNPPKKEDISAKFFKPDPPEGADPSVYPGYWESYDNRNGNMITRHPGSMSEEGAMEDAYALSRGMRGVIDAPYKKSWPLLAIKRMIRYAAENGFDKVAWTPGDFQNKRYDKSKFLNAVTYEEYPGPGGTRLFTIEGSDKQGREHHIKSAVKEDELAGIVGRDLAEKILNNEGYKPAWTVKKVDDGWQLYKDKEPAGMPYNREEDAEHRAKGFNADQKFVLSGVDLEIGGEAMRAFYDKMVPSMINKYLKGLGLRTDTSLMSFTDSETVAPLYEPEDLMVETEAMNEEGDVVAVMEKAVEAKASLQDRIGAYTKLLECLTS
jgi:hypothetical protein